MQFINKLLHAIERHSAHSGLKLNWEMRESYGKRKSFISTFVSRWTTSCRKTSPKTEISRIPRRFTR